MAVASTRSISQYVSLAGKECDTLCADHVPDANYLLKALQAWSAKGFPAYAVGIQVRNIYLMSCGKDTQRPGLRPQNEPMVRSQRAVIKGVIYIFVVPQHDDPSYPTAIFTADQEAQVK